MKVTAMLADSVAVESGKLYAQGAGWNNLRSEGFPLNHDRVGIGIIIEVPYTATNQEHSMDLRFEDADGEILPLGDPPPGSSIEGEKVRRLGAKFNVGRPAELLVGAEQNIVIGMNINGMVFEHPGRYRVVIEIDGSEEAVLSFNVTTTQPQIRPLG